MKKQFFSKLPYKGNPKMVKQIHWGSEIKLRHRTHLWITCYWWNSFLGLWTVFCCGRWWTYVFFLLCTSMTCSHLRSSSLSFMSHQKVKNVKSGDTRFSSDSDDVWTVSYLYKRQCHQCTSQYNGQALLQKKCHPFLVQEPLKKEEKKM